MRRGVGDQPKQTPIEIDTNRNRHRSQRTSQANSKRSANSTAPPTLIKMDPLSMPLSLSSARCTSVHPNSCGKHNSFPTHFTGCRKGNDSQELGAQEALLARRERRRGGGGLIIQKHLSINNMEVTSQLSKSLCRIGHVTQHEQDWWKAPVCLVQQNASVVKNRILTHDPFVADGLKCKFNLHAA